MWKLASLENYSTVISLLTTTFFWKVRLLRNTHNFDEDFYIDSTLNRQTESKSCLKSKLMNQDRTFVAMLSQIIQLFIAQRNNSTKPVEGASSPKDAAPFQSEATESLLKFHNTGDFHFSSPHNNTSSHQHSQHPNSQLSVHQLNNVQKQKTTGVKKAIQCQKQEKQYNYHITFHCESEALEIEAAHKDLKKRYKYRLSQMLCRRFYKLLLARTVMSTQSNKKQLDPQFMMKLLKQYDLEDDAIFRIIPSHYYLEIDRNVNFRIPNQLQQKQEDTQLNSYAVNALFGLALLDTVKNADPQRIHLPEGEITEEKILAQIPISSEQKQNISKEYRKLFSIEQNPILSGPQSEDIFRSFKVGTRLDDGRLKEAFVFNITETTVDLTKNVYSESRDCLIITGKGGTGKSMALLLYPTIFNKYIEPFLFANDLSAVSHYKDPQNFRCLSKVFYISVTQRLNPAYVFECLNQQIQKYHKLNTPSILQDYAFLLQIEKVYKKTQRKWNFVIIIDQINIYTSLLRRLEEGTNHIACKHISQFLSAVFGRFRIIYCSSNNLERSFGQFNSSPIPQSDYFQIFNQKKRGPIRQLRMTYEQNPLPLHRFLARLSTLAFQVRQRLHEANLVQEKHLFIEKIYELKQKALKGAIPKGLANTCCSVTHKSINHYFKQRLQEAIQFIKSNIKRGKFIEELMFRIRKYQMQLEQLQFGNFLNKGSQLLVAKKLWFLELLEQHAKLALETSDGGDSCCFEASGPQLIRLIKKNYFQEMFNRNISSYDQCGKKVTIFYSPQQFLRLTNGIKKESSLTKEIYFSVFQTFSKDPSQYGKRVDHCFTTIFSTLKLHLEITVPNQQPFIINTSGETSVFQHFSANEAKFELSHKFRNLIQKAREVSRVYFGAYPILKNVRDSDIYDEQFYSYSSPTIDALFFRKKTKKIYQVITFDFTVASRVEQFTKKYNSALKFFTEMRKKNMVDFSKYQFIHIISVLDEFLEQALDFQSEENKPNHFTIYFASLEQFKLEFDQDKLDKFTKYQYRFIKKRFLRPAEIQRTSTSRKRY